MARLARGRAPYRAAAMPGVGMLLYSAYIYGLTGNPLQWVAANAAWGRVYRGVDDLAGARVDYLQHYGFYNYATNQTLDFIQAAAIIACSSASSRSCGDLVPPTPC